MAQPEPAEIARHFHNAADQIALFNNLPAVHEAQMLQNIMDAITALRNDITALRNDMNTGFGRVETRLLAVEAGSLRV